MSVAFGQSRVRANGARVCDSSHSIAVMIHGGSLGSTKLYLGMESTLYEVKGFQKVDRKTKFSLDQCCCATFKLRADLQTIREISAVARPCE
jgi:hypothetical protein